MTRLERDAHTMKKIIEELKVVKNINTAVKKISNYVRYQYLRNKYPDFAKQIDDIRASYHLKKPNSKSKPYKQVREEVLQAIRDGKNFDYIMHNIAHATYLRELRKKHSSFDKEIKDEIQKKKNEGKLYGDELIAFVWDKIRNEGHTKYSLTKSRLITQKQANSIPKEERQKMYVFCMHRINANKPRPEIEPQYCEVCGKYIDMQEYFKSVNNNQISGYKKKKSCSHVCETILRKKGNKRREAGYLILDTPITFQEYILGELRNFYHADDHNYDDEVLIELFSRKTCLPIEYIERILSCQNELTVEIAIIFRDNGVGFKIDDMLRLQHRVNEKATCSKITS